MFPKIRFLKLLNFSFLPDYTKAKYYIFIFADLSTPTSTGLLAKYLIDPQNIFTDEFTRNLTMFTYGHEKKEDFAEERFRRDIAICNFFFDTPLITEIKQEVKTTIFDMISAVGGTIALFTGVSVITLAELGWWMWKIGISLVHRYRKTSQSAKKANRNRRRSGR